MLPTNVRVVSALCAWIVVSLLVACQQQGTPVAHADCEVSPTVASIETDADPGEALVGYFAAARGSQIESDQSDDPASANPLYGGVWGDFQGGWIVAVVDCSKVNLQELARIAGGSDRVRVIQVAHSFEQVNSYRDELANELRRLGVIADARIDSTASGRKIVVTVEDPDRLPSDFGSSIPTDTFSVEEGDV